MHHEQIEQIDNITIIGQYRREYNLYTSIRPSFVYNILVFNYIYNVTIFDQKFIIHIFLYIL
jgi:hypothetical protein